MSEFGAEFGVWLVGLAGLALTTVVSTAVGFIVKHRLNKRQRKIDEDNKILTEAKRKEREEEMTRVVAGAIAPVAESVNEIKDRVKLENIGTTTLLRDRMRCSLDYCLRQGYATPTDKGNWNELYNSYKDLGGNHFREYVDQWKQEMEELPTRPVEKKASRTKRKARANPIPKAAEE